jgi:hypothetical protein
VLHHVPDSYEPARLLTTYADALGPDCRLALSHTCRDEQMVDAIRLYSDLYNAALPEFAFRGAEAVADLLAGFELTEPGLVPIPLWLPEGEPHQNPERFSGCAALARRR